MSYLKNIFFLLLVVSFTACQSGSGDENGDDTDQTDTTNTEQSDMEEGDPKPLLSPPDSASATVGDLTVKVTFGAPSIRDRVVWGDLVPYDKVWRTGANEASTISFSQDVTINGEALSAGRYGLFTVPSEGDWTIILNKVWEQWGAYEYNEEEDILRFSVTPEMKEESTERMDFDAETVEGGVKVIFNWEKLTFSFMVNPA